MIKVNTKQYLLIFCVLASCQYILGMGFDQETKKKTETMVKLSNESQRVRSSLINKYKPNSENSRPFLRYDDTGKSCASTSDDSLIYNFESIIACMVTGFKDVCYSVGDLTLFEDFKSPRENEGFYLCARAIQTARLMRLQ